MTFRPASWLLPERGSNTGRASERQKPTLLRAWRADGHLGTSLHPRIVHGNVTQTEARGSVPEATVGGATRASLFRGHAWSQCEPEEENGHRSQDDQHYGTYRPLASIERSELEADEPSQQAEAKASHGQAQPQWRRSAAVPHGSKDEDLTRKPDDYSRHAPQQKTREVSRHVFDSRSGGHQGQGVGAWTSDGARECHLVRSGRAPPVVSGRVLPRPILDRLGHALVARLERPA